MVSRVYLESQERLLKDLREKQGPALRDCVKEVIKERKATQVSQVTNTLTWGVSLKVR